METHEKHCTMNPNRECRLCVLAGTLNDIKVLIEKYKPLRTQITLSGGFFLSEEHLKSLDSDLDGICPNCRLSILRQLEVYDQNWDYKKAFDETMKEINSETNSEYSL